jgi:UDP-GlcNAc:undecaprenyl-phosphate/decaprenyl-phosphate GlcNAc-1-phosphate transferase
MEFPFHLYLLAMLGAGLFTLATLPLWRIWCRRTGHVDDPGHRKIHREPVALAGGLAVITGIICAVFAGLLVIAWGLLDAEITMRLMHGLGRRGGQLGVVLAGAVGMFLLGWVDDRWELKPAVKFGGQLLVAAAVASAGVRITLFVPSLLFSYAVTALWILAVINAFNFMDNMNGLCAGLGIIGALLCGLIAILHGQYLVALVAMLTLGALLGFLPYNYPQATVFLGDAGSHLVGYLLAVLAILPHFHSAQNPHPWAVLSPLLILGVPLFDMAWVVVLRRRMGKPFYLGDNNHLSHRLVRRGWSQAGAVALIWLLAAISGGLSLVLQFEIR